MYSEPNSKPQTGSQVECRQSNRKNIDPRSDPGGRNRFFSPFYQSLDHKTDLHSREEKAGRQKKGREEKEKEKVVWSLNRDNFTECL